MWNNRLIAELSQTSLVYIRACNMIRAYHIYIINAEHSEAKMWWPTIYERYFQMDCLERTIVYLIYIFGTVNLRVQITMQQLWSRQRFGRRQATSYCLNQWRPGLLTHICVTRPLCVSLLTGKLFIRISKLVTKSQIARYWHLGVPFHRDQNGNLL